MHKPSSHSMTLKATGLTNVLITDVTVLMPDVFETPYNTRGIWDTGATGTVITQKVVDALQLQPTGYTTVHTAGGIVDSPTFLVDVVLHSGIRITELNVTLGKLYDSVDLLLGMDIITLGDFSVTNFNGNSCMSFRIPSLHQIDYVEEFNRQAHTPVVAEPKIGRNNPCYCGSGKKHKHCHGK